MDRQDERIEVIEEDAVRKEDFLRESGIARQRLDRLSESLARVEGKLDNGIEATASLIGALKAQRQI